MSEKQAAARVPTELYDGIIAKYGDDMWSRWVRTMAALDLGLEPPDGPLPDTPKFKAGGPRGRKVSRKELDNLEEQQDG